MELNEFKARLKAGSLGGCYMLCGEEDYLKKHYLAQIRRTVITDDAFATFNHSVYDGAEINFAALRDDITSPPMMSEGKLIEWRYPVFEKMKESDLLLLEKTLDILDAHSEVTLVFLVAEGAVELGTAKRESRFERRFKERIGILNFPTSTDAALLTWLKKHFDSEGIFTSKEALCALLFRSGHSMSVLSEEVSKLCMYAKARGLSSIGIKDIEAVASSTPECDTYALSNAILSRDKRLALAALDEMKSRRIDPTVIIGMMARVYSELVDVIMMLADGMGAQDISAATKMNAYKLKHYISAAPKFTPERAANVLRELGRVDTGAKFGGVSGYTAIEIFITKCV